MLLILFELILMFVCKQPKTSEVDNLRIPKYRDNRIDILKSSFEYLSKSGLENISMRDLCKGIGISIGSVYYWFENKEQLIAETAEYGLLKVSDDIFSHVLMALDDIHSSFEICMEKIEEHHESLRYIYQLACSPVYCDLLRKMCANLEPVYHEYAIKLSKELGISVDKAMPLVYLFVSAVLDFAVWGNKEQTVVQLDYLYKCFVEEKA